MNLNSKRLILVGSALTVLALVICLIYLNEVVTAKFTGSKWRLPSLVYGRPQEVYIGKELRLADLRRELSEAGYTKRDQVTRPGEYSDNGSSVSVFRRAFSFWDKNSPSKLISFELRNGLVSNLNVNERPSDLVRLEPLLIGGIYPHDFEDRKLVKLSQVPQHLIDALVVAEDQGFYEHYGVSITGIARALLTNIKEGRYAQGASTITQQLVKNFYLNSERSLKRKALEAVYAFLLELNFSKEEILTAYLNEVYIGQNGSRAIHGFGLGAEYYFSRSIENISLAEAALLVAVVNGPSYFNPHLYPERCLNRRNKVLRQMYESGKISEESYLEAMSQPLSISKNPSSQTLKYPGYLDLVKRHLSRDYEAEDLQQEGMRIFTAFNPHTQWAAEKNVRQQIDDWGGAGRSLEAAVIVADFGGDIEALVPGKQSGFAGFNRVLDAKRAIGSLVKPAILLAALKDPSHYSLATILEDKEIEIPLEGSRVWQPKNYDGKDHGQVLLYQALAYSYNQAFVRLGMDVGTEQVRQTLEHLGVTGEVPTNPAMLLGSFELSPLEVLAMFQTIASSGFRVQPRSVRYVQDYKGKILQSNSPAMTQSISPAFAHIAQYALQTVMYEGTGKSAYKVLPKTLLSAGKTGTTNDRRDSWFAGFTGDKVAVVWMGRDDNGSTPLTGSSGALQVWSRLMRDTSLRPLEYSKQAGLEYLWIDEKTGERSFEFCQGVRQMPFIKGSAPEKTATCIKSVKPILNWFKGLFGN